MKPTEKDVQDAKRRLENAQGTVATCAQLLTQIPGIRVKEGVVVDLGEWRELQDALAEWRAATQDFLATVKAAS